MRFTRRQMIARTAQSASALCLGLGTIHVLGERPRGIAEANHPQAKPSPAFPPEDVDFLRDLTREVVQAARVRPGEKRGGPMANTTGFTLIMPGGNYPAYWIRDFAMSLDSGCVTAEEMLDHLRLTARCQNGPEARHLKHGLIVPPFAIPDHINFDAGAVYYPGTYASNEEQGDGTYGMLPPIDDHFEFIHIAHRYYRATQRTGFLGETVGGITVLDRLLKAYAAPTTDPATGLVVTSAQDRAVGFGFCDSIYFTGQLLFPSLLRFRAANQLAELCRAAGRLAPVAPLRSDAKNIASHLVPTFGDRSRLSGWLRAATGVGRQPDVWGTLYALHLGALRGAAARLAFRTIADAVTRETITCEGAVRHVPGDLDASPTSAWEKAACAHNTYQNGAFWHTPTGWLIEALSQTDRPLARRIFQDYIRHLRQGDFRLGTKSQAPWECFGRHGLAAQNGVYMTSVAAPWAIIRNLSA